jgi:hypothetical protein
MVSIGLVSLYLTAMEKSDVIISSALKFVQKFIPSSAFTPPEKLKKIKIILESSRVALTLLGHADGPILKFVSNFC